MPTRFANRKDQIVHVAAELFSQKGYAATSMRDIAEHMEMEAASLYNHISSKEEILHTICFSMADRFINAMEEVNDIYFNGEEKLRMAVKNHVGILTENIEEAQVFLKEWRHLGEENLNAFIQLRDRYEDGIESILQTGIDENVFQEVDKKFAALNILSSVNWIVEWYRPKGKMTPEEIATKLSDFMLTGLQKKQPY
ncbi:MAG: TetR/AcrR family transcriptional regulator [Bacteroidota bacterium]|nr:TetR/AcrR family transcriptional regulator [Bacteroidota bacterium]MDX5430186.1 TetR/AcrR family transcriptional regulator [Bacteroidota bacterium]MDX5468949.1 TetR/AcrR family transcriptional regulator [Bacteroidota bacterium]